VFPRFSSAARFSTLPICPHDHATAQAVEVLAQIFQRVHLRSRVETMTAFVTDTLSGIAITIVITLSLYSLARALRRCGDGDDDIGVAKIAMTLTCCQGR
jgi:hypothetical protein